MNKDFERQIYFNMKHYPKANKLIKEITNCGETLLLGGALREFKDNRLSKMPRDFDIVVDTQEREYLLDAVLLPYNPIKNRFGGYKIIYRELIIDVWSLKNTWAFKENIVKCQPKDYAIRLQDTVFLNVDAIVYNLSKDIWYDEKYEEAMRTKILDVVLEENPQLALNVLRAVIMKKKYDMHFSERLKKIIGKYCISSPDYIHELMQIQLLHYKHKVISKIELENEIEKAISEIYLS